jgi:putative Mg2+ transporter-C (MgtC) family protein
MTELIATLRLDLLLKLGLAVFLGGIIGLEREVSGKPAGLRTNILICVGATLLTDVSLVLVRLPDGTFMSDPTRVAAQIITGIGFIGAGTIMQASGMITGLTSAATIWVVCAIGITIGAGLYMEATGAGLLVGLVLSGLGSIEHRVRRARRVLSGSVRARPGFPRDELESLLATSGISILSARIFDHPEDRVFELKLSGPARQYDIVREKLLANDGIFGIHID